MVLKYLGDLYREYEHLIKRNNYTHPNGASYYLRGQEKFDKVEMLFRQKLKDRGLMSEYEIIIEKTPLLEIIVNRIISKSELRVVSIRYDALSELLDGGGNSPENWFFDLNTIRDPKIDDIVDKADKILLKK